MRTDTLLTKRPCGQGALPLVGLIRNLVMYGFILTDRKMSGIIVVNFLLDEAIGKVSYTSAGTHYLREYFASRPDEVIVIMLSTPEAGKKLNFSVSLADGRPDTRQEVTKDGILFRRKTGFIIL
mgnify:CR=1 FL=1